MGKWNLGKDVPDEISDLAIISETGWKLDYLEELKETLDADDFLRIKRFYVLRDQTKINKGV